MPVQLYTLDALETIPDPEWLVTDVFQRDTLAAIAGPRNTFKTFVALDVGLCIATGSDWQGHSVQRGNVLHIFGEGGRGVKRRVHSWLIAHDLDSDDVGDRWRCTIQSVDIYKHAQELIDTIKLAYPKGRLDLLVIDTFARNNSADENSTQQMTYFVGQLDEVRTQLKDCCIVLVHHESKAGGFRGNTAVDAALNTIYMLKRNSSSDDVTVHNDKQKDCEEIPDFVLKRKLIPLPEDPNHPGMVLSIDLDADPDGDRLLKVLDELGTDGGTREQVKRICMDKALFGESKFNTVWTRQKDNCRIVPASGKVASKGTKWIRNLALIDLSF